MQVVTNILINANDHTTKGEITITAEMHEGLISVKVTDTGIGIDPELMPYIFECGISGANRTGIGLAISKEIIETQGGTIKAETELNKGTAIIFTLPIYKAATDEGGNADV